MSESRPYIFGLSEIETQHEEIGFLMQAVQDIVDEPARHRSASAILGVLMQRLKTHFELEEAVMNLLLLPDTERHTAVHAEILGGIEFCQHSLASGRDVAFKASVQVCLEQIRYHDQRFVDSLAQFHAVSDDAYTQEAIAFWERGDAGRERARVRRR